MSFIDPATGLDVLVKQPSEKLLIDIPLIGLMRDGDSIASVVSITSAVLNGGPGLVTVSNITFSGAIAQAVFEGGAGGEDYKITSKVNTVAGDLVEGDAILRVIES